MFLNSTKGHVTSDFKEPRDDLSALGMPLTSTGGGGGQVRVFTRNKTKQKAQVQRRVIKTVEIYNDLIALPSGCDALI